MSTPNSMVVIARNPDLLRSIKASAEDQLSLRFTVQEGSLASLNGRAIEIGKGQDLIAVETDPADPDEIAALRKLALARSRLTPVIALADGSVSLAEVQLLKGAGAETVLPMPTSARQLADDVARNLGQLPRRLNLMPIATPLGRVVTVVPARGGIGSTTLAVNLAERLRCQKRRGQEVAKVAIVDLDLQFGSVGSLLDLPEMDALARIAVDGTVPDGTLLHQAMVEHATGLGVLAAPVTFVPQEALQPAQVAAILDLLRTRFDFVIVDLPHAVAHWFEPVVERSDLLLLVTDTSVPSVRQGRRLLELLTHNSLAAPVRVVVNRESRPFFKSAALSEAERVLAHPVWAWLPADPRAARSAADQGRPLHEIGGPLSRAVARMARQIEAEFARPAATHKES